MSDRDRRTLMAEAALDIVADHGARALTHRAVDTRLGLPAGSTSYYLRTRRTLLAAAVHRLAARARADFDGVAGTGSDPEPADTRNTADMPDADDIDAAAARIATFLDHTVGTRRRDTVARYALVVETSGDGELHPVLARAAFSVPAAVALLDALGAPDPETAGADLVALAEGLVFDRIAGNGAVTPPEPGSTASVEAFRRAVAAQLRGATART
ncbi:transcriptional regulator, TetR family [Prauserella aidingensis]|uniref:TetR/AcrR family transcriptional regulator n=1 Tax=Prauserella aidingensis TaxID=387890 RepID=UPI0020A5A976|nr:TetR family transcriptional regulator [Prauserella aidingensis]MCP2251358.1 transcriptional regulator, TetR family [Prauserella aidingensis]